MSTRTDLKKRIEDLEEEISKLKLQMDLLRCNPLQPIVTIPVNPWPPNLPYIGDPPPWQSPVTITGSPLVVEKTETWTNKTNFSC